MLVNRAADRTWMPTDYPGIERSLFRNDDDGGRSSVVRLASGTHLPRHAHPGAQELVVISGIVMIGGAELTTGDYLYAAAGEAHDVIALTDAVIYVSSRE